jgi:hypothetical protein
MVTSFWGHEWCSTHRTMLPLSGQVGISHICVHARNSSEVKPFASFFCNGCNGCNGTDGMREAVLERSPSCIRVGSNATQRKRNVPRTRALFGSQIALARRAEGPRPMKRTFLKMRGINPNFVIEMHDLKDQHESSIALLIAVQERQKASKTCDILTTVK